MSQSKGETDDAKAAGAGKKKVPKLSLNKPPEPPPQHWLARLVRAPGLLATIWPLLLVVGAYVVWNQWGAQRVGQQFYSLEREHLSITNPPDYIHSDVVGHVFQLHQLERTSLLDRKATTTIGEAFRTHPWIQDVLRVEKRGNEVAVQVRYRQPVAAVHVRSRHPEVDSAAIFFVDGEGILLPSEDLKDVDQRDFLQIFIQDDTYPSGNFGMPFGDHRVMAAAQIAALLAEFKTSHQLIGIRLLNPQRTFSEPYNYVIDRVQGEPLIWGNPPGEEQEGELLAEQKLRYFRMPTPPNDLRIAQLAGDQ